MKVVVGLGNPGPQYRYTRHNAGFRVLDCLAGRLHAAFEREKYSGLIAEHGTGQNKVLLIKPLTFMNNSGDCVARVIRYNAVAMDDVLVVVDDVHLPLGRLRLRSGGSAGGHNGLKSIIERAGSDGFSRLRLGVGRKDMPADLIGFVLGRFAPDEDPVVEEMVNRAADAVEGVLADGLAGTMNKFNA